MIRAALDYAARGFRVLPLEPGGKTPLASLVRHGSHQASDDESVIAYWWSQAPAANVGVRCDDLCVIDLDTREDGEAKWIAIRRGRDLPVGPVARTATGGVHLLFRRPGFSCVGKLATGVDILTGFRYFVAAPSVRAEGRYRWEVSLDAVQIPEAPAWLAEMVKRPEPPPVPRIEITDDTDTRTKRAQAYLRRLGPAIEGSGGEPHTFYAAQVLVRGFALDRGTAWSLLAEWNASCVPPWPEQRLRRKLDQAIEHGRMTLGALLENRRAA